MFPREITSTSVWIRHEMPLCAPPPIDGDKKLRKQIKARLVDAREEVIDEITRQERARLDLKWCLDQYFGWNESRPFLGQLVTANIIGVVHLAYIVDITSTSVTVVPVNTFGISTIVAFEDIYSAECGPFFDVFLRTQRVNHPQHVLDWWARQINRTGDVTLFDTDDVSLVTTCNDVVLDWPNGEETWLVHDVLPQRSQLVHCKPQVTPYVSTANIVGHLVQSPSSSPIDHLSPVINDHPLGADAFLRPPSTVLNDRQPSIDMILPCKQLELGRSSPPTTIVQRKRVKEIIRDINRPSSSYCTPFSSYIVKVILLSLVTICLANASSYYSVMYDVEGLSRNLPLDTLHSFLAPIIVGLLFMSIDGFRAHSFGCKMWLREVNNWDWFRTLAVP